MKLRWVVPPLGAEAHLRKAPTIYFRWSAKSLCREVFYYRGMGRRHPESASEKKFCQACIARAEEESWAIPDVNDVWFGLGPDNRTRPGLAGHLQKQEAER